MMICRISHANFGEDRWWVIHVTLTTLHAELDCTPHPSFDQSAQLLPSLLTENGDFEQSSVDFIHFCIFSKHHPGDENIFDLVLDVEVQLQSL